MRLARNTQTHEGFRQAQTALPVMWGLEARAQSQISPGASALSAPHQQFCGFEPGGLGC